MDKLHIHILILFFMVQVSVVYGEDEIPELIDRTILLEDQQREHILNKHEIDLLSNHKPAEDYNKTHFIEPSDQECININEIRVAGANIVKSRDIVKTTDKYLGLCIFLSDINNIIQELNESYFNKGYITTRTTLPMPQTELAQGIVNINVTEGYIDDFHYIDQNKNTSLRKLSTAFPGLRGGVLNLRDIEQGVEQMNTVLGNNAAMEILPGGELGGSVVVIQNTTTKRGSLTINFDNSGQAQTGEDKVTIALNSSNLFSLNDSISISRKMDQNSSPGNNSYVDNFSLSMPYGYYSLNYSLYKSNYKTTSSITESDNTSIHGGATGNSLTISKVISRGKKYKTSVNLNLNVKRTNSYNVTRETEFKSDVSSRKLSIAKITSTNNFYSSFGTIIFKPSYRFGLNILGALDDNQSAFNQEAQYESWLLYVYYGKRFNLYDLPLNYNLSLDSQYSNDTLFPSESFSVGGEFSVRGFKETYSQGESGYTARNDFIFSLKNTMLSNIPILGKSTSTIFYDYGMAKSKGHSKHNYLSGTGVKLSYNKGPFNSYITYAKSLHNPSTFAKEGESVYFNISLAFDIK